MLATKVVLARRMINYATERLNSGHPSPSISESGNGRDERNGRWKIEEKEIPLRATSSVTVCEEREVRKVHFDVLTN